VARGDYAGAHKVFKVTLKLMMVFGLIFALFLYGMAGVMVDYGFIRDSRAYLALVVLTPAVFFSSILASFRGYFQGYQLMTPPAVSQILEQFVRVVAMVLLAYLLLPYGLAYAAAGAAFGAIPGSLAGLVVLSYFYRRARKTWQSKQIGSTVTTEENLVQLAKRLVLLAVPVSCANLLIPVTSSIDMILVPNCLGRAGFEVAAATTLFGYLSGMAQPLLMMSLIPTISIAASLVPSVSAAFTLGTVTEIKAKTLVALKLCLLITLPATLGMYALAAPISKVLYGTVKAAAVIANLAPSIVFLGIFQVTTGALQGMGLTAVPMWNMVFGAGVRIVALWFLTSCPVLNIVGAAWASNLNYLVVAVINVYFLYRKEITFPWWCCGKTLLAAVVMGALARAGYVLVLPYVGAVLGLLLAVAVGAVVYAVLVLQLGILTAAEVAKLPWIGKKLQRFVRV
jgi:stage V sporulation protein B